MCNRVLLASWGPDTLHLMMPGSLEEDNGRVIN
jgi:hypothetical protein